MHPRFRLPACLKVSPCITHFRTTGAVTGVGGMSDLFCSGVQVGQWAVAAAEKVEEEEEDSEAD